MDIEMAAANRSESRVDRSPAARAERVYWDIVWTNLAEADGHDRKSQAFGASGKPSIHIKELKKRLERKDAKTVGVHIKCWLSDTFQPDPGIFWHLQIEIETGVPKYVIRHMVSCQTFALS